jgi:tryptophanyl-tRNA synthetase
MKKRLLSGIQPTGKLHLGNYLGAVQNWVALQNEFQAIFLIVDLHSLTTVYENPSELRQDKTELALDLLGLGLDPETCILAFQSDIPQHSELHLILSMLTPLQWLYRVPTYKSKIENVTEKDLGTYGFLGYPVLMAADILLYKADVVPVGLDQLPHLELCREIGRRFNHMYGQSVFPMVNG